MSETFQNLTACPSFSSLEALAEKPFDLTAAGALSEERLTSFQSSAAGFCYLYGTQRIDRAVLDAFAALAEESDVVDQFESMVAGETMNRIEGFESENRSVLHTACRDVFDDEKEISEARDQAVADAKEQLERLKTFLNDLEHGERARAEGHEFTDMVQVGIGGSDLGPRSVYQSLKGFHRDDRRVHFVSNVDPDDAAAILDGLDLYRTLVVVVSKSGTTLETLTNLKLFEEKFEAAGLNPKEHFLSVTGKGSPMDDPKAYLRSFHMFDYIGGRYSVTSMVGGVALGFGLGYDRFLEFLAGAREMDINAGERNLEENLPLLSALLGIWNRNFLGCPTLAIIPYSQSLARFVAHLQQVDMESNGKRINRSGQPLDYGTGPIVWGEPGTNGQHAFFQLLHQSEDVVPIEFIGFRDKQLEVDAEVEGTTSQQKLLANLLAQSIAFATGRANTENPNKHFPGNRPNSMLFADRLTPKTLGALMAFFENRTAFQGFLWNINSFDQEGVQLGKILAESNLDHMKAAAENPDYAGESGDPEGWAMIKALEL